MLGGVYRQARALSTFQLPGGAGSATAAEFGTEQLDMIGEFFGGSLRQVRGKSDIHPGDCEGADFVELGAGGGKLGSRSILALGLARLGGFFLRGFLGALFLGKFCGRLGGLCRCCLLRLPLELFLFGAQGLDERPGSFGVELFAVSFPAPGVLGCGLPARGGCWGSYASRPSFTCSNIFGIAKGGHPPDGVAPPPVWVG